MGNSAKNRSTITQAEFVKKHKIRANIVLTIPEQQFKIDVIELAEKIERSIKRLNSQHGQVWRPCGETYEKGDWQ